MAAFLFCHSPMLHSSRFRASSHNGFTLIEIMVVLVVIGIATALVTLSLGDATRPQETKATARQLYGAMNMALEDAVFLHKQIGLVFDFQNQAGETGYSYEWLYYDADKKQWLEISAEGFEKQELPAFIQLDLEIDGQKIVIGGQKKNSELMFDDKDKKQGLSRQVFPDLYFLSSGEMQNFTIMVSDKNTPDSQYLIQGDMLGQMTFKRPDEKEE